MPARFESRTLSRDPRSIPDLECQKQPGYLAFQAAGFE